MLFTCMIILHLTLNWLHNQKEEKCEKTVELWEEILSSPHKDIVAIDNNE